MNSRENNTLRMLRGIWKQGTDILNLLESDNSDDRYRGSLDGLRWISRTKVCFENLFYNTKFYDDFISKIQETEMGKIIISSYSINLLIGHIEGLGQMLKFGYLKDQFSGVNNESSDICFVAMSFAPEYEDIYSIGIKPAVESAGYKAIRVDSERHNEKIDSKIIEIILRSRFVIADFTGQRNGVYYESGYAKGLGLPVIQTCQNNDFNNLHFDIRSINTLHYDTPSKLTSELQKQIIETIGSYKPPQNNFDLSGTDSVPF